MASLEEITDRFRAAVEAGEPLARTLKFDLKDAGCVMIDGRTVSNDDRPADLVITTAKADLEDIGKGRLDPMSAVMTGRLKISNMALAMQLQSKLRALFEGAR